jgi:threonine/homoserine/homoserine lactone efflux protein
MRARSASLSRKLRGALPSIAAVQNRRFTSGQSVSQQARGRSSLQQASGKTMWDLSEFVVAALLVLLVPGPTNTLLAAHAATSGARSGAKLISAEVLGYALTITALKALIAPLIVTFPWLEPGLRMICSAYLAFTAWQLLKSSTSPEMQPITWLRVFFTTASNPKALLFVFVILPPIQYGAGVLASMHGLVLLGLITFAGSMWVSAGAIIHAGAGQRGRSITRRVSAAIIACFSVYIFVSTLI